MVLAAAPAALSSTGMARQIILFLIVLSVVLFAVASTPASLVGPPLALPLSHYRLTITIAGAVPFAVALQLLILNALGVVRGA